MRHESLPRSQPGSVFRRYLITALGAVLLIIFTTLLAMIGSLMAMLGLSLWALPIVMGIMGFLVICYNHIGLLGNRALERRLRQRLGGERHEEFVGLGQSDNNTFRAKYLAVRVETDDNIGLFELRADRLVIRPEEGRLPIALDAVKGITTEPMIDLPYLSWIRVTYTRSDGVEDSVLMSSRQVSSLRQARRATHALYQRLVSWLSEANAGALDDEFAALEAEYGDLIDAAALQRGELPDRLEEEFAALEAQFADGELEFDEEELAKVEARLTRGS